MTRGVSHPAELRAEVVDAVLAGATIADAARRFGLSKQTVSRWVGTDVTDQPARDEEQTVRGLLIDLLSGHVVAIQAQLQAASRPDWLEKQSAAELAQLVAVERDTAVRLLAGLYGAARSADQPALDAPASPDRT